MHSVLPDLSGAEGLTLFSRFGGRELSENIRALLLAAGIACLGENRSLDKDAMPDTLDLLTMQLPVMEESLSFNICC
jgi:hypothetical protein